MLIGSKHPPFGTLSDGLKPSEQNSGNSKSKWLLCSNRRLSFVSVNPA